MKFAIPQRNNYYSSWQRGLFSDHLYQLNNWLWATRAGHIAMLVGIIFAANTIQYPSIEPNNDGWTFGIVMVTILMACVQIGAAIAVTCGLYSNMGMLTPAVARVSLRAVFFNSAVLCLFYGLSAAITSAVGLWMVFWFAVVVQVLICGFGVYFYFTDHGKKKDIPSWKAMLERIS